MAIVDDFGFSLGGGAKNALVYKPYAALSLFGTEAGGAFDSIINVNGSIWMVTNGFWNLGVLGFQQNNSGAASSAVVLGQNPASLTLYSAPANAPLPIVWTVVPFAGGGGSSAVSTTANQTSVASNTSPVQLLAANPNRQGVIITNDTNNGTSPANTTLGISLGSSAGFAACPIKVNSGGTPFTTPGEIDVLFTGAIYGCWNPSSSNGSGNGAVIAELLP